MSTFSGCWHSPAHSREDCPNWLVDAPQPMNVYRLPSRKEKLCKDCRWISVENEDYSYAKCLSPQSGTSLVSGQPHSLELYCEIMRQGEGHGRWCGREGRFWEPKTQ